MKCPKTITNIDPNTLVQTPHHPTDHRFLRGTTYPNRTWDARCLTCDLRARLKRVPGRGIKILDTW
jgi:hypothetical protein